MLLKTIFAVVFMVRYSLTSEEMGRIYPKFKVQNFIRDDQRSNPCCRYKRRFVGQVAPDDLVWNGHRITKRDDLMNNNEDWTDAFNMFDWWHNIRSDSRKKKGQQNHTVANNVRRVCFDELLNAQFSNNGSYISPMYFRPRFSDPFKCFESKHSPWSTAKLSEVPMDFIGSSVNATCISKSAENPMNVSSISNSARVNEDESISTTAKFDNFNNSSSFLEIQSNKTITSSIDTNMKELNNNLNHRLIISLKDDKEKLIGFDSRTCKSIGNFCVELIDKAFTTPKLASTLKIEAVKRRDKDSSRNSLLSKESTTSKMTDLNKNVRKGNDFNNSLNKIPDKVLNNTSRKSRSLNWTQPDRSDHVIHQQSMNCAEETPFIFHPNKLKQSSSLVSPPTNQIQTQSSPMEMDRTKNDVIKRKSGSFTNNQFYNYDSLQDRWKFLDHLHMEILKKREELNILQRTYNRERFTLSFAGNNYDSAQRYFNFNTNKTFNKHLLKNDKSDEMNLKSNCSCNRGIKGMIRSLNGNDMLPRLSARNLNGFANVCVKNRMGGFEFPKNLVVDQSSCRRIRRKRSQGNEMVKEQLNLSDDASGLKLKNKIRPHYETRKEKRWLLSGNYGKEQIPEKMQDESKESIENAKKLELVSNQDRLAAFNKKRIHFNSLPVDYSKKFTILENDLLDLKTAIANMNCCGCEPCKSPPDKDTNNVVVHVNVSVALFNSSGSPTECFSMCKRNKENTSRPIIGTSVVINRTNSTSSDMDKKTQVKIGSVKRSEFYTEKDVNSNTIADRSSKGFTSLTNKSAHFNGISKKIDKSANSRKELMKLNLHFGREPVEDDDLQLGKAVRFVSDFKNDKTMNKLMIPLGYQRLLFSKQRHGNTFCANKKKTADMFNCSKINEYIEFLKHQNTSKSIRRDLKESQINLLDPTDNSTSHYLKSKVKGRKNDFDSYLFKESSQPKVKNINIDFKANCNNLQNLNNRFSDNMSSKFQGIGNAVGKFEKCKNINSEFTACKNFDNNKNKQCFYSENINKPFKYIGNLNRQYNKDNENTLVDELENESRQFKAFENVNRQFKDQEHFNEPSQYLENNYSGSKIVENTYKPSKNFVNMQRESKIVENTYKPSKDFVNMQRESRNFKNTYKPSKDFESENRQFTNFDSRKKACLNTYRQCNDNKNTFKLSKNFEIINRQYKDFENAYEPSKNMENMKVYENLNQPCKELQNRNLFNGYESTNSQGKEFESTYKQRNDFENMNRQFKDFENKYKPYKDFKNMMNREHEDFENMYNSRNNFNNMNRQFKDFENMNNQFKEHENTGKNLVNFNEQSKNLRNINQLRDDYGNIDEILDYIEIANRKREASQKDIERREMISKLIRLFTHKPNGSRSPGQVIDKNDYFLNNFNVNSVKRDLNLLIKNQSKYSEPYDLNFDNFLTRDEIDREGYKESDGSNSGIFKRTIADFKQSASNDCSKNSKLSDCLSSIELIRSGVSNFVEDNRVVDSFDDDSSRNVIRFNNLKSQSVLNEPVANLFNKTDDNKSFQSEGQCNKNKCHISNMCERNKDHLITDIVIPLHFVRLCSGKDSKNGRLLRNQRTIPKDTADTKYHSFKNEATETSNFPKLNISSNKINRIENTTGVCKSKLNCFKDGFNRQFSNIDKDFENTYKLHKASTNIQCNNFENKFVYKPQKKGKNYSDLLGFDVILPSTTNFREKFKKIRVSLGNESRNGYKDGGDLNGFSRTSDVDVELYNNSKRRNKIGLDPHLFSDESTEARDIEWPSCICSTETLITDSQIYKPAVFNASISGERMFDNFKNGVKKNYKYFDENLLLNRSPFDLKLPCSGDNRNSFYLSRYQNKIREDRKKDKLPLVTDEDKVYSNFKEDKFAKTIYTNKPGESNIYMLKPDRSGNFKSMKQCDESSSTCYTSVDEFHHWPQIESNIPLYYNEIDEKQNSDEDTNCPDFDDEDETSETNGEGDENVACDHCDVGSDGDNCCYSDETTPRVIDIYVDYSEKPYFSTQSPCQSQNPSTTFKHATIHPTHRFLKHRKDPSLKKYHYNATRTPFVKISDKHQDTTDLIYYKQFSIKIGLRTTTDQFKISTTTQGYCRKLKVIRKSSDKFKKTATQIMASLKNLKINGNSSTFP